MPGKRAGEMVQQKTVRACIWRYVFDRHNVIDSGPSDGWVFSLSGEAFAITVQLLQTFSICAMLIWPLSFALPNVCVQRGMRNIPWKSACFPCGYSVLQAAISLQER